MVLYFAKKRNQRKHKGTKGTEAKWACPLLLVCLNGKHLRIVIILCSPEVFRDC